MAAPKTMTGARAQLAVIDPNTNEAKILGIFNSVNYGLTYDVEPIYIMGRYSAAETVYTAQSPVGVSATGWRVIGNGPHKAAKVPALSDLMAHEYMELAIYDRQTGQFIAKIHSVRPTGYSTSMAARSPEEVTVNFVGLLVDDEDTTNTENVGASTIE